MCSLRVQKLHRMKKTGLFTMAALMLGIGTLNTGCMGSFGLTKKVYNWNDGLTGNKFADNLVFYLLNIVPVYGVCLALDFYIFNLVEFWSGSNPVAMKEGEREEQVVQGEDGNSYQLTATRNHFD